MHQVAWALTEAATPAVAGMSKAESAAPAGAATGMERGEAPARAVANTRWRDVGVNRIARRGPRRTCPRKMDNRRV